MSDHRAPEKLLSDPKRKRMAAGLGVGAILAVAALALIAILATRSKDSPEDTVLAAPQVTTQLGAGSAAGSLESGTVTVQGSPLVKPPESGADTAIGTIAPTLTGEAFDGSALEVKPGSEPMVVVFVAHWCPHCQREVPLLAKWATGGTRNGVSVRAVSTGMSKDLPNYPPSKWLKKENFTIPTIADDEEGTAAQAYGLTGFPYFVALSAEGKVVARSSGELSEAEFDQLIAVAKG